jgi:alpha-glucosidase
MSQATDWWRRAVIYQIYPRSFRDTDGDGVGDLRGIAGRLEHVAWLGADAVWISPFFRSPMKDFGYDVEDHRAVDPIFGGLADLDAVLAEARRLGLRVLIDLVLSHCADTHPWFVAASAGRGSAWDDCFVWADPAPGGGPPNNWLSVFGGSAWGWCEARGQYYLHNFLPSQPDWNYHSPEVRREILDIARFWLERGVSGFRLDAVNFCVHDPQLRDNPPADPVGALITPDINPYSAQEHLYDKNRPELLDFLAELGQLLAGYPGAIGLGEVGAVPERASALAAQYTAPGRLQLCYSFDLLGERFDADYLRAVIARAEANEGAGRCWALSNHDVVRPATRLCPPGGDPRRTARAALALLLSLRGTPCLYQGEALGLPEAEIPYERLVDPYGLAFWPEFKGRDGCRTPMPWEPDGVAAGFSEVEPWLPVSDAHRPLAAALQRADPDSTLSLTRALLALRRRHPALQSGALALLGEDPQVLAFLRSEGEERVVCAFNLSSAPARWGEGLRPLDGCPGEGRIEGGAAALPPWSWCFARQ